MSYGVVQTPRVYIDNVLFARAIGMPLRVSYGPAELWDFDPIRTKNFSTSSATVQSELTFDSAFHNGFSSILETSNYFAILNHNLASGSDDKITLDSNSLAYNGNYNETVYESVGTITIQDNKVGTLNGDITTDGFALAEISLNSSYNQFTQFDFLFNTPASQCNYNIGCYSLGTYLDFPFSPDLEVKAQYSHEGVSSKRTVAGKDITHVSYYGAPNWGDLPPFTDTNTNNECVYFAGAGLTVRKSWDMKFSYVDKTDMFNQFQYGSSAGTHSLSGDNYILSEEQSILGTYLSRTLGGKLKHILQPDNTKNEFYLVKLNQKSININQVAPGVFEISLKFVQVW